MTEFKNFLLKEETEFLAQKIGDILAALQSLEQDSKSLGNRQLMHMADNIVKQMRRVLITNWSKEEMIHLKSVQKAAVALAQATDTNQQMPEVISGVRRELESLLGRLKMPVNRLVSSPQPIQRTPVPPDAKPPV